MTRKRSGRGVVRCSRLSPAERSLRTIAHSRAQLWAHGRRLAPMGTQPCLCRDWRRQRALQLLEPLRAQAPRSSIRPVTVCAAVAQMACDGRASREREVQVSQMHRIDAATAAPMGPMTVPCCTGLLLRLALGPNYVIKMHACSECICVVGLSYEWFIGK